MKNKQKALVILKLISTTCYSKTKTGMWSLKFYNYKLAEWRLQKQLNKTLQIIILII